MRGPSIKKAKVSYCVHDLLNQLFMLDGDLAVALERNRSSDGPQFKRQIATAVLNELRNTQDICGASRRFSQFRLRFVETYWHDQVALTSARLDETWSSSGRVLDVPK